MGQWCDLLFGDTVQWPQPFWSTDFKLKYDIFLYFSHWRSQFKLDLSQTWYDEYKQVSDQPYCLVSRSSDHSGSGWLVFRVEIWHFLYISHWRLQFKLDLNQTWYDESTLVSNHSYCFVSRSSDHSRSGPLISSWNMTFSYTFRTGDCNSSWISTKLGMMNEH